MCDLSKAQGDRESIFMGKVRSSTATGVWSESTSGGDSLCSHSLWDCLYHGVCSSGNISCRGSSSTIPNLLFADNNFCVFRC